MCSLAHQRFKKSNKKPGSFFVLVHRGGGGEGKERGGAKRGFNRQKTRCLSLVEL